MNNKTFGPLLVFSLLVMALVMTACREEEDSAPNPPPPPPYGTGSLSFTASDSSKFSANGPYTPSTEVATDFNGSGAGGFLYELVMGGKRLKGQLMAFRHGLSGGVLDDRVFLVELYDSAAGALATGNYNLVRPDTTATGKFAVATFIFFSNADGLYYVYQSRSGSITISTIDPPTNHLTGFFSGTLRSLDDTTQTFQIVHGEFDALLGTEYFIYKTAPTGSIQISPLPSRSPIQR